MEIIGITGSIFGMVDIIARSVSYLIELRATYNRADLKITLLISQLSTLKIALERISSWIETRQTNIPEQQQLADDLTVSMEGCKVLIMLLDERICRLKRSEAANLKRVSKA